MEGVSELKFEEQKKELLQVAEQHFGIEYFKKLDQMLEKIEDYTKEKKFSYTVTVNNRGAFYASEK